MLLIDSFISTEDDKKLQEVLARFLQGETIMEKKYISIQYKNETLSQYRDLPFLTFTNGKYKEEDFRENILKIKRALPDNWKLQNSFGFVCEVIPNKTIDV